MMNVLCSSRSTSLRNRILPSNKVLGASFVSSNAVLSHQEVQSFHDEFWMAFAARQLKADLVHQFKKKNDIIVAQPLPLPPSNPIIPNDTEAEDKNDIALRQLARNDLFKHAHMVATSRGMKRGDGILSRTYSLEVQDDHRSKHDQLRVPETPTLIDIATARRYRESMHHKFWDAHRSRLDRISLTTSRVNSSSPKPRSRSMLLPKSANRTPLPSTLHDAYLEFGLHEFSSQLKVRNMHPRAIAITEATPPFKIVEVNKQWVDLCGYSRKKAVGKTLKDLLQGPDTDLRVAKSLVASLLQGQAESEAVLTNYRSDKQKFRNHIRVGPIKDQVTGKTTHFVGVFKKMSDNYEFSNESDEEMFGNM